MTGKSFKEYRINSLMARLKEYEWERILQTHLIIVETLLSISISVSDFTSEAFPSNGEIFKPVGSFKFLNFFKRDPTTKLRIARFIHDWNEEVIYGKYFTLNGLVYTH